MFYVIRMHGSTAKNKLHAQIYEESYRWDGYLVETPEDFHRFVEKAVGQIQKQHRRCKPVPVQKPLTVVHSILRMNIGGVVSFYFYQVLGRFDMKGGFQGFIEMPELLPTAGQLRPLTSMSTGEFDRVFGNLLYPRQHIEQKIAALTTHHALHTAIATYGHYQSYTMLQEMGFDVQFQLAMMQEGGVEL